MRKQESRMDLPQIPQTPVTVDDAVYDHKNDVFPLRDIFILKNSGASRSKRRRVFPHYQAGNRELRIP